MGSCCWVTASRAALVPGLLGPGWWPCQLGESPEEAVRRKCREEIGVELVEVRPIEVQLSNPELVPHAFLLTQWVGQVTNAALDEHDVLGWFTGHDLPRLRLADPSYLTCVADRTAQVRGQADRSLND